VLLTDEIRNLLPLFWGIQGQSPPCSLASSYPALLKRVTNNDNRQKTKMNIKTQIVNFYLFEHKAG
jgi:hypothetical protein